MENKHSNHITLIRIFLAIMVLFSHSFALSGIGTELIAGFGNDKYGTLAVKSFFVLSGLLITKSYIVRSKTKIFLLHRILRIFPGYWFAILITVSVILPFFEWYKNGSYLSYWNNCWHEAVQYILQNWLLWIRKDTICHMFANNHYPYLINGSIWTLIYEFICYLSIPILYRINLLKKSRLHFFVFPVLCLANILLQEDKTLNYMYIEHIKSLVHFFTFFYAGMLWYIYHDRIAISPNWVFLILFMFLTMLLIPHANMRVGYVFFAPLFLPILLFSLAYAGNMSKWESSIPDISYGLYVYGSVVQQSLVYIGVDQYGWMIFFIITLILDTVLALLSFYMVEQPFMRLKKYL